MVLLILGFVALPAAADDAPRVVVCFERRGVEADGTPSADVDVEAECLAEDGTKAWGQKARGVGVGRSPFRDSAPVVCPDGSGGAIVVYTREPTEGPTKVEVVAERLAPDGKRLWVREREALVVSALPGTARLPAVVGDGAGGAILAYVWTSPGGQRAVLVQRLRADGEPCWNREEGGLLVAGAAGATRPPLLLPDGAGGAFVLFEWIRKDGSADVWAQRVSAEGKLLWRDGERPAPVSSTPHHERNLTAVSDGRGGLIVVFEVEFTGGKYAGDVDVMAQRVSPDGELLWREGKGPVAVSALGQRETNPVAVPDGSGGAIVAFEIEQTEGDAAGDTDVYAQRLDAAGSTVWNEGRQASAVGSSAHRERRPVAVAAKDGGIVVVYEVTASGADGEGQADVYAQRLDLDGEMLWNEGKRSSPVFAQAHPERTPSAVPDGSGGLFVVALVHVPDTETVSGAIALVAQRVDGDGHLVWKDGRGAVLVAASTGPPVRPSMVRLE